MTDFFEKENKPKSALFIVSDEYLKKYEIKQKIIREIRQKPIGFRFYISDYLNKFDLTAENKQTLKVEIFTEMRDDGLCTFNDAKKNNSLEIQKNLQDFALIKTTFEAQFDKIKYDFYFQYSLGFGEAKLSPTCFALWNFQNRKLYVIGDKEKTKVLFDNFLNFTKTAPEQKKSKLKNPTTGYATGVVVQMKWAKKPKYLFKKKPSYDETKDYLKKVFEENGVKF